MRLSRKSRLFQKGLCSHVQVVEACMARLQEQALTADLGATTGLHFSIPGGVCHIPFLPSHPHPPLPLVSPPQPCTTCMWCLHFGPPCGLDQMLLLCNPYPSSPTCGACTSASPVGLISHFPSASTPLPPGSPLHVVLEHML